MSSVSWSPRKTATRWRTSWLSSIRPLTETQLPVESSWSFAQIEAIATAPVKAASASATIITIGWLIRPRLIRAAYPDAFALFTA